MSARPHLSPASELQGRLSDLAFLISRLHSLIKIARDQDYGRNVSPEDFDDLMNLVTIAADLAADAKAQSDEACRAVIAIKRRMEAKPEAGDCLPGLTLAALISSVVDGGAGRTAFGLAQLATALGAYAQHDAMLKPALDAYLGWIKGLGIEARSVKRENGNIEIGIVSAPGGADALIGTYRPNGGQQ